MGVVGWLWLGALFLVVSGGCVLYRQAPFLIYNDTPIYWAHTSQGDAEQLRQQKTAELVSQPVATLRALFEQPNGSGYRPLESLDGHLALVLHNPAGHDWLLLSAVGFLYGLLFLALFFTARRFVCRDVTAVAGAFLMLCTPASAASAWVYCVSQQAIVLLLMCCTLLCYWKVCESRYWPAYLVGLAVLFLLGPWYREVLLMTPVLIGFLELQRTRRPTWVLALTGLALVHALYPTALMKALLFPELPLKSVFSVGNSVSHAMESQRIRWRGAWTFVPQFPPSLLLLAALPVLVGVVRFVRVFQWSALNAADRAERRAGLTAVAIRLLVPAAWVLALLIAVVCDSHKLGLVVCLGFVVVALQRSVFLAIWFLAMFLPILRVYTMHIHFLYATVPAAIILAVGLETLWDRLQFLRWRNVACTALASLLLMGAADQALTLLGAYRVNHATYGGIRTLGEWAQSNLPPGSAVVANVAHVGDVRCYAHNSFDAYLSLPVPPCLPSVDEIGAFQHLLHERGDRKVYLLDVDCWHPPAAASYHRNKYASSGDVPLRDLGVVQATQVRYPFADPLRCLFPRQCVPFLGAPDLAAEFYSGPSRNGVPFCFEVAADYHLYEIP